VIHRCLKDRREKKKLKLKKGEVVGVSKRGLDEGGLGKRRSVKTSGSDPFQHQGVTEKVTVLSQERTGIRGDRFCCNPNQVHQTEGASGGNYSGFPRKSSQNSTDFFLDWEGEGTKKIEYPGGNRVVKGGENEIKSMWTNLLFFLLVEKK